MIQIINGYQQHDKQCKELAILLSRGKKKTLLNKYWPFLEVWFTERL